MILRYVLALVAICGVVFAIYVVKAGNKAPPVGQAVTEPTRSPFPSSIAGAGLIEASTENIAIGTLVPGIVTDVYVKVGDKVKAGDPLFKIDDRNMLAEQIVRRAAVLSAKQELLKLQSQPRAEDIPPLEAKVLEMQAALSDKRREEQRISNIGDDAISKDEQEKAHWATAVAEAQLAAAQADLARTKAGAWAADIEIAKAQLASAEAQSQASQIDIDRLTVRASVDGQALQVKVRAGEYAPAGVMAQPLVLLGNVETLNIRVDIDENDAWRLKPDSRAVAYVRGNRDLFTDLKYVRVEPYIVPKRSLTGDSSERVDTRVLQIIYSFASGKLPVYVGQQMDVVIAAEPLSAGASPKN